MKTYITEIRKLFCDISTILNYCLNLFERNDISWTNKINEDLDSE